MSDFLYNSADSSYHLAAQFFTLIGKNLVGQEADDSHNTSIWDETNNVLLGRPFSKGDRQFRLGLDILNFSLFTEIQDSKRTTNYQLENRCVADLKQWVNSIIHQFNGRQKADISLHYDTPAGFFDDDRIFEKPSEDSANAWSALRSQANQVMAELNQRFNEQSEVNIWPHHFDTGVYFPLKKQEGQTTTSIGAGLAIADDLSSQPYYYIYGWNRESQVDFSDAPQLTKGTWKTESWKGAILPVKYPLASLDEVATFYREAMAFYKAQLQ